MLRKRYQFQPRHQVYCLCQTEILPYVRPLRRSSSLGHMPRPVASHKRKRFISVSHRHSPRTVNFCADCPAILLKGVQDRDSILILDITSDFHATWPFMLQLTFCEYLMYTPLGRWRIWLFDFLPAAICLLQGVTVRLTMGRRRRCGHVFILFF